VKRAVYEALIVSVLLIATLASAPGKQKFSGAITDSMCDEADHSRMRMGPTDAECTIACVAMHDAKYILYDGRNAYTLSDENLAEKFAGRKVTVTGTLDAKTKTIHVDSITTPM
jgi:hypothetical protein